jgi:hypothetical protein
MIASNREKERWIGSLVTLNDKPARIVGRKMTYPRVCHLDGPLEVKFSWQAVKRIMLQKQGKFYA